MLFFLFLVFFFGRLALRAVYILAKGSVGLTAAEDGSSMCRVGSSANLLYDVTEVICCLWYTFSHLLGFSGFISHNGKSVLRGC